MIRVRWANFETITRQRKLEPPSNTDRDLITAAMELLNRVKAKRSVRLIGFGVTKLIAADEEIQYQPDLFEEAERGEACRDRDRHIDDAVDSIRRQFGGDSIGRGLK